MVWGIVVAPVVSGLILGASKGRSLGILLTTGSLELGCSTPRCVKKLLLPTP